MKLEPKELGDTQDLDELNLLDPLKEVAQWDQIEPLKEDVTFFLTDLLNEGPELDEIDALEQIDALIINKGNEKLKD